MPTLTAMVIAAGLSCGIWGAAKVIHVLVHPKQTMHRLLDRHPHKPSSLTITPN